MYDNVICTYTHTNEGICLGDSGGPLVVSQVQVGVMSWVVPCGRGVPDAYARVTAHYEWVLAGISQEAGGDPEVMVEQEDEPLKFSPIVEI